MRISRKQLENMQEIIDGMLDNYEEDASKEHFHETEVRLSFIAKVLDRHLIVSDYEELKKCVAWAITEIEEIL
jgi:hypothetical protein